MGEEPKPDPAREAVELARAMLLSRLGAVALAPSGVLWIAAAVHHFLLGAAPQAIWVSVLAAGALGFAALVLARVSPAYGPAVVFCYFDAFLAGVWAYGGMPFLWIACAGAASAALLLSTSRKAFPGLEPEKTAPKDDSFAAWAKENLEAVVVAFIMALVIRCFCIEVFKIPSSSMEPTLMGDNASRKPSQGDRIMVTKYYYALNPVERFDVVVFKFPLNQVKNFIKRVVGLPGEDFFLERGNLYTRPTADPGADYELARKPLRVQQSVWIRDLPDGLDAEKFDDTWDEVEHRSKGAYEMGGGRLRTVEHRGSRTTRFRYRREVTDGMSRTVGEVVMAFDLELRDKTGYFFADIPNEWGRFRLELSADTANRMKRITRTDTGEGGYPLPTTLRLQPERIYHVEFMVYDGAALAIIDGRVEAELVFGRWHKDLGEPEQDDRLAFGSRDCLFALHGLRLGRDIHYKAKHDGLQEGRDHVVHIPPDHFMMMGDNVNSSHDSRAWKVREFVMKDGSVVRCEKEELNKGGEARERWARERGLKESPDEYIAADQIGYERGLYRSGDVPPSMRIQSEAEEKPYPFVDRKFLVGKALWVWWPYPRWFRLIR